MEASGIARVIYTVLSKLKLSTRSAIGQVENFFIIRRIVGRTLVSDAVLDKYSCG